MSPGCKLSTSTLHWLSGHSVFLGKPFSVMGTVHPQFLPCFLFPCDHRRVIRSRERGKRKRHKRKRNGSFQDGEWIIQIHLDLHMTDVILKKKGKMNHTLNAQGNHGISRNLLLKPSGKRITSMKTGFSPLCKYHGHWVIPFYSNLGQIYVWFM